MRATKLGLPARLAALGFPFYKRAVPAGCAFAYPSNELKLLREELELEFFQPHNLIRPSRATAELASTLL